MRFRAIHLKHSRVSLKILLAALALVLVLAGCVPPPAPVAGGAAGESAAGAAAEPARTRLIVGVRALPTILDAQQSFEGSIMAIEQIGQPLIRIDNATNELIPDFVESWVFAEDGLSMIFNLPAGAVYSNGDPLDAQAVKDALLRNKEVSPYASDFEALTEINVVDATTVELLFSAPPPAFLTVLNSSFGGPWNVAQAQAVGNEAFAVAPIASGPFAVKEFIPDSELLLVRNENYSTNLPLVENKGPVHLTEMLVREIPEEMTMTAELEAGTIDVLENAPAATIDRLRNSSEITVIESRQPGIIGLVANLNQPFFADLQVRQAIAKAVNRDELVKVVIGAVPVHAFITQGMVAYSAEMESYGQELHAHDIAAAQALMAEAGWTDSDGDGIVEKDGTPFAVELLISTNAADQEQAGQVLQSQLKEIGIDIQIVKQDTNLLWELKGAGEFDLGFEVYGWPDPDILSLVFGAPWWNSSKYDNPEMLEQLIAARNILDTGERTAAYAAIQKTLLDDVVEVPLWQRTRYLAVRNSVKGLITNGPHVLLNDVTIDE